MKPVTSQEISSGKTNNTAEHKKDTLKQSVKLHQPGDKENLTTLPKIDSSKIASEILESLLMMPEARRILNEMSASRMPSNGPK
ncbi:MAG: hypothetical protein CMF52_07615 [Legionellales bacterium]|nr:hypothetical protein [Legionellales bacterium]HAV93351.1 hypothetical protein [Pseudomonadota bacterium]